MEVEIGTLITGLVAIIMSIMGYMGQRQVARIDELEKTCGELHTELATLQEKHRLDHLWISENDKKVDELQKTATMVNLFMQSNAVIIKPKDKNGG